MTKSHEKHTLAVTISKLGNRECNRVGFSEPRFIGMTVSKHINPVKYHGLHMYDEKPAIFDVVVVRHLSK